MSPASRIGLSLVLHPDSNSVAVALAEHIAAGLQSAIESRGQATLVVSGGSTPRPMFEVLAQASLDWSKVIITLADERIAPPHSADRNDAMIRQTLMTSNAAQARFIPLLSEQHTELQITQTLETLNTYDVVILGMGNDGHTASLFPGAANLNDLLASDAPPCARLEHPGLEPPRISQSLRRLTDSRQLFVHTTGPDKWQTLQLALSQWPQPPEQTLPILSVIEHSQSPVQWFHGQRSSS